MSEHLTGGCLCGAVRYEAKATRTLHYMCHCIDCQKYGGGSKHEAIVVSAEEIDIQGETRVYTKPADSGRTIARYFCGDCGGHLFTSPWPEATRYSIKAGTLDDTAKYQPKHEIWQQSIGHWVEQAPDREGFEQGFTRPVAIGSSAVDPEQDKF